MTGTLPTDSRAGAAALGGGAPALPPPLTWRSATPAERLAALRRPEAAARRDTAAVVQEILADVRAHGDAAVRAAARRFDGFTGEALAVTAAEWTAGYAAAGGETVVALERAAAQIERFHALTRPRDVAVDVSRGVSCRRLWRPLASVGLYIPGGTAPLPSTVLMLGIPAGLAGCRVRIGLTPVGPSGEVHPAILAAARIARLTGLYKVGGAHGIAAAAYGTATVPRVDKIFGPGNAFVTQAKLAAAQDGGAACDPPAGPSEVMVLADADATPAFVAADLLSQAEHGADSHVVLVAVGEAILVRVRAELGRQVATLPRRRIAEAALAHAAFIVVATPDEGIEVANAYAPEHLILQVAGAERLVAGIQHAGSVFVGPWSPEAVGDYASGTNHVLPTYGAARVCGGLSVASFMKAITVQELTPAGLADIGPVARTLAQAEGLAGHARAIDVRLAGLAGLAPGPAAPAPAVPARDAVPAAFAPAALARPAVVALTPYASARGATAAFAGRVLLDANELGGDARVWNRYPEPQPAALLALLSERLGIPPAGLFLGRGADEAIDLLLRVFCEAGRDAIVVTPPTYGYYACAAAVQGAAVLEAPLVGPAFELNEAAVLASTGPAVKLVFVCAPNNPTGLDVDPARLVRLAAALAPRALLVVDEAYVDFSGRESLAARAAAGGNLVVLRTLSKAWGLAGVRLGVVAADPGVVDLLNKVRAPYPISGPAAAAAQAVLPSLTPDRLAARVAGVTAERARLAVRLEASPLVAGVWPSAANFLLVRASAPERLLASCARAGVVIRDRTREPGLSGCLRISVGAPAENDALLAALAAAEDFG